MAKAIPGQRVSFWRVERGRWLQVLIGVPLLVEVSLSRVSSTWTRMRGLLAVLYCWLALGCSGGDAPGASAGPKQLGQRCEKTEECASRLCVRLDDSGGICSKACESAQSCPTSDNWDCLGAPGQSFSVCACLPLADHEVCGDGLDNDCNGSVDDCQVCSGVPVPTDHHENCGSCGVACRADQVCDGKACGCPESAPEECGGKCTSVLTDAVNCGQCGSACSLGQTCERGECICDDFVKNDFCPGSGCLDLATDASNCGSCGNACTLGQTCSGGDCVCPADGPRDFCEDVGCVDLKSDPKNCGTCGNTCDTGQSCAAGKCACPTGQSTCDGSCVDLATDEQNCGECGAVCPIGQACAGGVCGCNAATTTACGDDCADLSNDVDNCGTCGNACADGEQCAGQCQCQSGVYCGSSCMPEGDEQNCGACGNACSASQYCNGGRCECQGFGLTKCGDACYDVYNDALHCGSCGRACRSGEQCVSGDCQCSYGETFCAAAGKCVPLATDATNCGSCGNACNPTESCTSGVCACPQSGQKYCAAQGKCVDVQFDAGHCGSCETKCKTSEVCNFGTCDCAGSTEEYCSAAKSCVDVWTSNQHCGACDAACPAGTQCSFGSCRCPVSGETLCGSTCVDLQTSKTSCGRCDNACSGGQVCQSGQCRCPNPSVGSPVRLTNNSLVDTGAVAAWDGTHIGVAYLRQIATGSLYYNLRFALLNPDGTVFKDIALTSYLDGEFRAAAFGFSGGSNATTDRPGLTWNGAEYAVVWVDYDGNKSVQQNVKLVRISAAGVPTAAVTVVPGEEVSSSYGPSVVWSVPYAGYLVSGYSGWPQQTAYLKRVGAQGTALEQFNGFTTLGSCPGSSVAVSPSGAAAVSCRSAFGAIGFFNPDGSRTRPSGDLSGGAFMTADPDTFWDGTTFDTALLYASADVRLLRDGRKATVPYIDLLGYDSSAGRSAFSTVWQGGGVLALSVVQSKSLQLRRFRIPTDLNAGATSLHDPVTVLATPNVVNTTELAAAGPNKLLAIWQDDRWDSLGELYAAPIDAKGCP